ncbi:MAG: cell division/cell wall cluster transcriptional repressor MraZ [Paludibacteraceae bacterium]|jgi:MraZ protein|nr:cell division/cell wall cluster transcriptional repressor MraZ [Paludibacteraceae bacterium]OQA49026.1 MAG: cell division protein MraZ [Bacteroidetes bacterium ADurb.Bin302]HPG55473.1 cell division/cell wall cluster transcriptional repressor MraZ [Candidatus Enterocola sp.]
MPSFIGNIEAKVDAKGRAFVPAQFRRLVDENSVFVLRKGIFDDCLVLYPEAVWEEIIGVMRQKLSRWNRKEEQVFRQFVAEANRIELEDNGRMLIPKRYIESIGIKNDIRFVGCDTSIEIWPSNKIEETFISADSFAAELEKLMEKPDNSNNN